MKIAVITSSYPRFEGDGIAQFVRSISLELASLGHDVEVVAPFDQEIQTMTPNGVRVHRFRYIWPEKFHIMGHARALYADTRLRFLSYLLLPFFFISSFLTLMSVTKRQRSQIIHAHWVVPNGFVAACVATLRGIPLVVTLHGSDMFLACRNRFIGFIAGWILNKAKIVTACSRDLLNKANQIGATNNVILLPWGVDPEQFSPQMKSKSRREAWGWEEDEFVVACLGRLVYKKGFNILLESIPSILEKSPNTRFVIAGDGPLHGELEKLSEELGVSDNLSLIGRLEWNRVPDYLANSDVFILPSIEDEHGNVDGLPTVLLEAMGSGTPVIASDIAGVGLVIKDEKTGLLFTPGDAHELSDKVLYLFNEPHKMMIIARNAREAVETSYTWRQVALQLVEVFNESFQL